MSLLRRWHNFVIRRLRAHKVALPPLACATLLMMISIVVATTVTATAASNPPSPVSRPAPHRSDNDTIFIDYTIVVSSETSPWLDVHMTIAPVQQGTMIDIQLPEGAAAAPVSPQDVWTHISRVDDRTVRVYSDVRTQVAFTYSVRLRSGLVNPAALPSSPYASIDLGEFVYIAGDDTLAQVSDERARRKVTVSVSTPTNWKVFAFGIGEVSAEVAVADPNELVLLAGPLTISSYEADGIDVTFVVAGDMPWRVDEAAESVRAMIGSLRKWGFAGDTAPGTFVQLRYPGALRLNPLISSVAVPGDTIVHWIGSGSTDWWRKHAARDIVRWLVDRTLTLAPDAAWFAAGVPEYIALVLLHDAGYETDLELYRALRALYQTGVRYTGPGWPSLTQAGETGPRSHSEQRVLEFLAPAAAFLLDAEIRSASGGTSSLIDLWLDAADRQRREPDRELDTLSLLSSRSDFGDLNAFAERYLFGTRIPPIHFDTVFHRWSAKK